MAVACYMMCVGEDAWRVARWCEGIAAFDVVPFGDEDAVEGRVDAAMQRLSALGYAREPIVLGLPSSWCLSATIPTDGLERSSRRRAMLYRLEEHLPVSAEQVVADFVDDGRGEAAGVCVEIDRVRPIIMAMESRGASIRHICPVALLAASHALTRWRDAAGVVIEQCRDGDATNQPAYDLIETRAGRMIRWWWFADDLAALRDQLATCAQAEEPIDPMSVVTIGMTCDPIDTMSVSIRSTECPIPGDEAALGAAAEALMGDRLLWIDLRRDALAAPNPYEAYRGPFRAVIVGVVALMLGLAAATYWRGHRYEALAERYIQQQGDVFRVAMPGQRVPGNIKARLLSEKQKLAGLGGQGSDAAITQWLASPSALAQLGVILQGLPTQLRFRIADLNVQTDLIRIDGQARSHADADQIAAAVQATGFFEVDPPRTQSLREGGVSFLLTARPRHVAVAAGEAQP